MKKTLLAVAILTTGMLFSCKSGGDPKAVLISFFDALAKKDAAAAKKFATEDSKSMLDLMEMGFKETDKVKDKPDDKFDKSQMEFGEPKIDGDKATIAVKEKSTGETTNFTLKKESGAWKVAFNKSSMMEMGMDKMKDAGSTIADSISNSLDKLKDININSAVEEATKKLEEEGEKLEEAGKKLEEEAKKLEEKADKLNN